LSGLNTTEYTLLRWKIPFFGPPKVYYAFVQINDNNSDSLTVIVYVLFQAPRWWKWRRKHSIRL